MSNDAVVSLGRNLLFVFDYLSIVIRYLLIQIKLLNQLLVSHANATLVVPAPVNERLNTPKLATAMNTSDCTLFLTPCAENPPTLIARDSCNQQQATSRVECCYSL
jgi:hypothetical protein